MLQKMEIFNYLQTLGMNLQIFFTNTFKNDLSVKVWVRRLDVRTPIFLIMDLLLALMSTDHSSTL